jgi:hypothetical protein
MRAPTRFGEAEQVDGAVHAGLGGLHGVVLVMDGRGGAGEVVDFIHLHVEREGDIVPLQLEVGVFQQMRDVGAAASEKIIYAQHFVPSINQAFAQMRAEEACPAGDEYAFVIPLAHRRGQQIRFDAPESKGYWRNSPMPSPNKNESCGVAAFQWRIPRLVWL